MPQEMFKYLYKSEQKCANFRYHQGLSQDLETGCQRLVIVNIFGHPIFRETAMHSDNNYTLV